MTMILIVLALVVFVTLVYLGRGYWGWVTALVLGMLAWWLSGVESATAFNATTAIILVVAGLFGLPMVRARIIGVPLMGMVRAILPTMSDTERAALEAGTVWWDGDLFSGKPDWSKLLAFKAQPLSEEEQAFIDGPVEEFCTLLDDWQIAQDRDLPPEAWDFIKKHKLFGMIIPKEYGGCGFSAIAHSAAITKISSRSTTAAVTVMVPNSLGAGELLLHYGTDAQKDHYLPRLARAEDIPCFALTEPGAGSDAANGASHGIVTRGIHKGQEVLGLRLTFEKRYITLAPISTLIGLSFRALDPDRLLGGAEDLGITCALLPGDIEGMEIGRRHDPMGVPFLNGPVFGRDVFIPLDYVIGGRDGIGQGWRMLMESLAAGRSISLPALSVGAVELSARVAGAYATVREQFGLPVGRFEGVQEALARIGGYAYFMNAARVLTAGAVDAGERPGVPSAIVKAYLTEGMRGRLNDAMDIRAGADICRGPRNILGRGYIGVPISITVEGANILIRSLIIFGQGAIRCHPFVREEMEGATSGDAPRFDAAFFGHINHVARNATRSLILGITGAGCSPVSGPEARYYKSLTRLSSAFAFTADMLLMSLGGELKRREALSGRMADVLAWMYLASAALKRFHDEDRDNEMWPFLKWSVEHALWNAEQALQIAIDNVPGCPVRCLLKLITFPFGPRYRPPSDRCGADVADSLLDGRPARDRVTADIHIPPRDTPGLGALEAALDAVMKAQPARDRVKAAVRKGGLEKTPAATLNRRALEAGVIGADELELIEKAQAATSDVIQVDVFDQDVYAGLKG